MATTPYYDGSNTAPTMSEYEAIVRRAKINGPCTDVQLSFNFEPGKETL